MKKVISLIAAIALMASVTTTAFAATNTIGTDGGTADIPVKAKYNDSTTSTQTISVDIEWGKMEFTYNVAGTQTWNPATHTYTDNTTAQWTAEGNSVKVTNHSNVDVDAKYTYTKTDENVDGAFTYDASKTPDENGKIQLAAGEVNQPNAADSVNATLALSGDFSSTSTTNVQVGTVTVAISKHEVVAAQ